MVPVSKDSQKTIRNWISDLEQSTQGFIPGNTVRTEEIERQRDVAKVVGVKMDLYPNSTINPLTIAWMTLLSQEILTFRSLYREDNLDSEGNYTISDPDRIATMTRLSTIASDLDSRRDSIAKAMSVVLSTSSI